VDSKDIDIEVHGLGVDEVAAAIPGDVNLVGKSFGVFTTRINGQDFDVSLPRRDSNTGEGHRGLDVELDSEIPLEEAFGRRDYRMNSMGPAAGRVPSGAGTTCPTGWPSPSASSANVPSARPCSKART
jgi:tRNA nucleotidyltransferase (CCA-adding enzyme)